ncbi:MAG: DUF3858 domain-containing protein [Candidatus Angelobacter sp.]
MTTRVRVRVALLLCGLSAGTLFAQINRSVPAKKTSDALAQKFVSDFDISAASEEAEARLKQAPQDITALLVRMETGELQERQDLVLDSALRLCALPSGEAVQKLASSRILQHASNTRAFSSVIRRVRAAAAIGNDCTFNLRLALVAAAADGNAKVDLDHAALSAGLLTHFRIAGPFGHYNNLDFERRWPPEIDQLSHQQYANDPAPATTQENQQKRLTAKATRLKTSTERFWFRDGMLALPDYLSGPGIFYAAADVEVPTRQVSQIEVLTSGAYAILLDGKQVLLHDARYDAGASRDASLVPLSAGRHQVVIKFTADAAPLSLAMHPQFQRSARKDNVPQRLEKYTQELVAYFTGDFINMERMLDESAESKTRSTQYVRALLYSAAEEHTPRADAAWKAMTAAQPSALLARLKTAESAMVRGQLDEARPDVMTILAERPQSETALQLAFTLLRSQTEAPALLGRLLELHPSCARLADAVKFFSSTAEQDKARQIEQQLPTCAPESLQYARVLAEAGRNSAAAAYLQQLVLLNPLHRSARRMLVEQLELSNQLSAARLQARLLRDLAPNARSYAHLADDPSSAQDSKSQRAIGFTGNDAFYAPYRRSGLEVVQRSEQRSFSGGSAVILLLDKVIEACRDGSLSIYTHRITRPLNKDGISHYGEVTLPRSADLLELRTIKASGQIIEPELAQQTPAISMPALEIGDAVEEEFVTHYADPEQVPETAAALTFGSFAAPILYSRLVLLSPPDSSVDVRELAGAPQPLVGENNGTVIRIWQRDNIGQSVAESFLPAISLLPTVTVTTAEKTRDHLRDQLIDATRAGLRVNETALALHLAQITSESERARSLYRFVTTKIDSTGPDWAGNSAEETLQNGQGSRTSALLALAHTVGLKAGLILARKVDQSCGKERDFFCYTEPVVRFWFADGEISDVDAESDDLPFGALPPLLETRDALFVPLLEEDEKKPEFASLTAAYTHEKSVANADLSFHQDDLSASLDVRLGASRAQEIRSLLRSAGQGERQAFFEQLALRIFPGATMVEGAVVHQDDVEQSLEISLRCTVPQFITRQSGVIDIDQLVPALGLRALYVKTPARKFPLFIESLFFESTTFHLHLPDGMKVRSVPSDFAGKNEFGEYSVRYAHSTRQVDIHREFRIPVQVVAPEKYAAFATFAQKIEEAERQRISLEVGKDASAARQYRVPPATGMLR